jgi:hypothetical protein
VLREGAEEAWARGHAAVTSCVRQLQVARKNLHRRCPSRRHDSFFHFFKVLLTSSLSNTSILSPILISL